MARSRTKQGNRKNRVRLKEVYETEAGVLKTRLARDENGKVKTVGLPRPALSHAGEKRWAREKALWQEIKEQREAAARLRQETLERMGRW